MNEIEAELQGLAWQDAASFSRLSSELARIKKVLARVRRWIGGYVKGTQSRINDGQFRTLLHRLACPIVYVLTTARGSLALVFCSRGEVLIAEKIELPEIDALYLESLFEERDGQPGYLRCVVENVERLKGLLPDLLNRFWQGMLAPVAHRCGQLGEKQAVLIPCGRLSLLPLTAVGALQSDSVTWLQLPSAQILDRILSRQASCLSGSCFGIAGADGLPFAEVEIRLAKQYWPSGDLAESWNSWDTIVEKSREAVCVHVASHAFFDPTQPGLSHICLPSGETVPLPRLMAQPPFPNARLVILSACQTGLHEYHLAVDEALGFPAVLHQSGVTAVITTLWPVEDVPSLLLIQRFYEYLLLSPRNPALALHQARRWLATADNLILAMECQKWLEQFPSLSWIYRDIIRPLRNDPTNQAFSHPIHWSGFVLSGI